MTNLTEAEYVARYGETPSQWRIACMTAKYRLWRNSGLELSDAALAEGLAATPEEIAAAKAKAA